LPIPYDHLSERVGGASSKNVYLIVKILQVDKRNLPLPCVIKLFMKITAADNIREFMFL